MPEKASPWQALYNAAGGRAALAVLCRVTESTLWRWSRGGSTTEATRLYVNELCDKHNVAHVFKDPPRKEASNA